MGNYKKKNREEDERTIPLTLLSVGFLGPTVGFVGMFFGNWGTWLFIGCALGLVVGLWLDSSMIKANIAKKKAAKLAIQKEEERRARIRAEKKNNK
ncbi:MAG: hypothetical protein IKM61_10425 [Eubacteriaceae bacterium]|nr:hypothetical protein [Eubacteriaceae bacterium]